MLAVAALVVVGCSSAATVSAPDGSSSSTTTSTTSAAVTATETTTSPTASSTTENTTTTTDEQVVGVVGGETVGDPYFPGIGNTGYDVTHYDLNLEVDTLAQTSSWASRQSRSLPLRMSIRSPSTFEAST